jgi:hypothetical protein
VLWKKTTHEFEKNVKTIKEGPQPHLRELLAAYVDDVKQVNCRRSKSRLFQSYQEDVTTIFDQQPPEPDKQIKDFRAVSHDFKKAVMGAINPPEPETPT